VAAYRLIFVHLKINLRSLLCCAQVLSCALLSNVHKSAREQQRQQQTPQRICRPPSTRMKPSLSFPRCSGDRTADLAAVAILVAVGVIAALTFRDYGLGWDDYTHAEYGDLLLSLYGSGFRDTRALSFVNLYMYGGGFDMLAALLAKIL